MGRKRYNKRQDIATRFERARRRSMASAAPGLHKCVLVLDGLKPDFNVGKIFRSADAFAAREIHLIGGCPFDPDPAKGSVRWVSFYMHQDFASCYQVLRKQGYSLLVLEPSCSTLMGNCSFAEKTAFILGHEEFGISFDRADYSDIKGLSIPQWGHVQSLNVSVAASIVLYEYVRQHGRPTDDGMPQVQARKIRQVNMEKQGLEGTND